MTGPSADDPDLDPEILEELEFWTGPDGPVGDGAPADGTGVGEVPGRDPDGPHPPGSGPVGSLVVVGTPIGNLGDLSPRAVRALAQADVLYCEDTRHSRKLLTHAGLTGKPLRSLHEHNEVDRRDEVVRAVRSGATVALVSDAGMPGISDPGAVVVRAVAEAGLVVTVVPGPSAVLTALVASGLPTGRFCFEGFLPRSGRERRASLAAVATETRTTVLFEAPGRVAATLADLAAVCGGERPVSVSRELTKVHEEHWRGTLAEGAAWAVAHPIRGEVVLVLGGAPDTPTEAVGDDVLVAALHERLGAGERTRGVVDDVASTFGVPRRRVYELALAVRAPAPPGVEEDPPGGRGGMT
jgi:16S rRNA (cytidine1402-2'-O)-methyltransferase